MLLSWWDVEIRMFTSSCCIGPMSLTRCSWWDVEIKMLTCCIGPHDLMLTMFGFFTIKKWDKIFPSEIQVRFFCIEIQVTAKWNGVDNSPMANIGKRKNVDHWSQKGQGRCWEVAWPWTLKGQRCPGLRGDKGGLALDSEETKVAWPWTLKGQRWSDPGLWGDKGGLAMDSEGTRRGWEVA